MKILLLSDTTMCADAGGFSQTLYNIFSLFEPDNILCITSTAAYDECKPSTKYESRYIYYQFGVFKIPRNRLAKYVLPLLEWINYNYTRFKRFRRIRRQIVSFAPNVVISCSN